MLDKNDNPKRPKRKTFRGVVLSDKMDKTRVVSIQRTARHPFYEKVFRKNAKFYAHDEGNESHAGDIVEIISTRPLSKLKRWRVSRVVSKAR
ncbi:MAG: 30S ribosomal protein S17 [Elusimicrobia bacterium]|nr:30S ribosomal protein S17 [Elusimicrobiota bacterium]